MVLKDFSSGTLSEAQSAILEKPALQGTRNIAPVKENI